MNKVKSVDLFSHISAPLPYPTKQYAEQTKKIGILSQNILNLWKKLTGWVLLIGLPHQNTTFNIVEHMISWVTFKIFFLPCKATRWLWTQIKVKSAQFFLCLPPPQNNMNVEHMKQIEILSQFWNLFRPDLTMKLTCWVESLLQTCPPVPYKTLRPFNIRANLASRVMIQMSFPSPTTKQYVVQIKTIHLESFLKVTTPRPYTAVR